MTRSRIALLGALLAFAIGAAASAQPEWALNQNDPNPFCNDPGSRDVTIIAFALAESARVSLEVFDPDTTEVVKILVYGALNAGQHQVVWDGTDDGGDPLPEGSYPYVLTANDIDTGAILFEDALTATIFCPTLSDEESWGQIKRRFGAE